MKKCCGVHALRIAVGITMLALLLAGSARAVTITVNASGGGDYTRIQDAIDNASAGDTILVYGGIYHENVNITRKLILRGIGNPVVDAGGSGSAITLAADGIILEGFTATGSDYDAGIWVTSSTNTINGNNASNNWVGISLSNSSNNTLSGNKASNNNWVGIRLSSSSNNTLSRNNVTNNNEDGISLVYSSNNTLSGNNASNNGYGIYLSYSSKNTLSRNKALNNNRDGIRLSSSSSNNTLNGNNASNNGYGIYLSYSSNNTLSGNKVSNNGEYGIYLSYSSNNTLSGNKASNNWVGISLYSSGKSVLLNNIMKGNNYNFELYGDTDSDFENQIDKTNLVDGKPVYFIKGEKDIAYDSSTNAGTFYCMNCVNVTIKNLNLNKNGIGIYFWNTSQSRIQNVTASNNNNGISLVSSSNNTLSGNKAEDGIYLVYSSNNTLSGNKAGISLSYSSNNTLSGNKASNNWVGISLVSSSNNTLNGNNASNNYYGIYLESSRNNLIYNNIFNNTENIQLFLSKRNKLNITGRSGTNIIGGSLLGGNFWGNPKGTGFSQTCRDANGDGICDKSYSLDENNIDHLPLAKDKIPPKSVRNLKNVSYASSYINWTWKDPKDIDFNKVMVFIDSKFKKNVSKGKRFYNATNFKANTRHTISTLTVDMNGNINKTWKNSSAWTAK